MPGKPDTAQELQKIYNEIDAYMRQQPQADRQAEHSYLIQQLARSNRIIARYESELRAFAQLRNSLVHNPIMEIASPMAYPHTILIKRYSMIRDALTKPRLAMSIAIPAGKVYTATLASSLNQVLKDMNKNIFTHVPIMESGKMIGVFSENALLSYLADKGDSIILRDTTLKDFEDYLPIDVHKGEKFEFLPRTAKLSDVYDLFNQAIKAHVRIGMLFITEHGKATEVPLGIITAWDLASPDFDLQ